jgi:hypothetical protein
MGRAVRQELPDFVVEEATIAEIHEAMAASEITARQLVEHYLRRIGAYDKQGPSINAIIHLNPNALARADELDAAFATGGFVGPLHGIPVIVKDNYDTHDMPTTGGSLSLQGSIPPDDAFQVRKLRDAGAIVIAKSNMAEFAFSPYLHGRVCDAGSHEKPLCFGSSPCGFERWNRSCGGRQFWSGGCGNRHWQFDSWAVISQPARGHPLDDGTYEP